MHKIVDAPGVAEASIGKVLPYPFGVLSHAPAIPVRTGAQATLREAMTATDPPNGGSIKLHSLDGLRRFPRASTVQIEGERCTYTGRDETPGGIALTGITRAAEGSIAAVHALGTPVNEVVVQHVYVVCENPGEHRPQAVDAVYLNGIVKDAATPPTHVVNLQDTSLLFDEETGDPIPVVSVTFDLSTITAAQSEYLVPSTLAALKTWLETYGAHAISGGSGGLEKLKGMVPVSPTMPTAEIPVNMGGSVMRVPMRPKVFPVPQLGSVEVDLRGLQDDAAGTITGTPNLLMTRPAHITRCLLREAFQQRQQGAAFDLPSWATAAATQGVYNLAWAMLFYPVDYPTFQRLVSIQSRTDVYRDPGGAGWRAVFRRRVEPTYTSAPSRRLDLEYRTTQAQGVLTTLTVRYGEGTQQGVLPLNSPTALARFLPLSQEVLMPWITSAAVAEELGRFQLALNDHVRREATLTETWQALAAERTDAIAISAQILDAYGDLPWRVRGFRIRPDGTITLDTEEEALGFEEWFKPGDALSIVLTEAIRLMVTPRQGDGLPVQIAEIAVILLPDLVAASDTLGAPITEAAIILVPTLLTVPDAAALAVVESLRVTMDPKPAEALPIKADDVANIVATFAIGDVLAIPINDSAAAGI